MQALIVDDSATACRVLARHLARHDVDSSSVHSAEQALDHLQHHRPNVIFMDHSMPGMDGLETVRALKRNPETATIPVIMYTARDGEVYMGQARALGAVDVISKDHLEERIEPVVRRLRERAARRQNEAEAEPAPAPAPAPARTEGMDELTRQMYLILTEQQRAQKLSSKRITETLDDAMANRLERLATRLESVAELHSDSLEEGARRRFRRALLGGAFVIVIVISVLLLTPALLPPDSAVAPELEARLESLSGAVEALRAREIAASPATESPSVDGAPTDPGTSALVARAGAVVVGYVLGTRTLEGVNYHEAVSDTGFLFGISAAGRLGWPLGKRYFLAPGCNGDPMVEALSATVFRDSTGELWYTPTEAVAEQLRTSSVLDREGRCVPAEGTGSMLVPLLPNEARITGLAHSMDGLRVTASALGRSTDP